MPTFNEYYTRLQIHEGLTALPLVAPWLPSDVEAIVTAFRAAFDAEGLRGAPVPIRDESTNQSIGNQVADFFIGLLHNRLPQHQVVPCPEQVIQTGHFSHC
jgi:hypothetical protein